MQTQSVTLLEAPGDIVLLAHFTQALLQLTDLYSPAAHGAQGPPLTPVNPCKHWKAVSARNPSVCLGGLSSCFCASEWAVCHRHCQTTVNTQERDLLCIKRDLLQCQKRPMCSLCQKREKVQERERENCSKSLRIFHL
jgi:hypothetical protein